MSAPEVKEFQLENKPAEIVRLAPTPMDLLYSATQQGANVDTMSKLLDLQMRWEANEAKKAFRSAMAEFKKKAPEIVRNRTASFGSGDKAVSYDYATLDHVCDALTPALSEQGITHGWRMEQKEGKIKVTCVLSLGIYSEDGATLEASPDTSGAKNSVQAIGSTVSYLERYTFLGACGIAVKGQDTDTLALTPELEQQLLAIREAPDTTALKDVSTGPIQKYMKATQLAEAKALIDARDKRKKELLADEPA
jgi:hypothetical protein